MSKINELKSKLVHEGWNESSSNTTNIPQVILSRTSPFNRANFITLAFVFNILFNTQFNKLIFNTLASNTWNTFLRAGE